MNTKKTLNHISQQKSQQPLQSKQQTYYKARVSVLLCRFLHVNVFFYKNIKTQKPPNVFNCLEPQNVLNFLVILLSA